MKASSSHGSIETRGYARIAEDDALEISEDDPDVLELDPLQLERQ